MTASERYRIALMRYGDEFYIAGDNCGAYAQYAAALAYGALDEVAATNSNKAYQICYPPTATPEPTEIVVDPPPETETPTP